jgi:hypothetical protein
MFDLKTAYGVGCFGEFLGNKLLAGSTLVRQKGYDILWENKKVEVKTSSYVATADLRGGWCFYFPRTQLRIATHWFLILLDENQSLHLALLIPKRELKVRGLTITRNTLPRYLKYAFS